MSTSTFTQIIAEQRRGKCVVELQESLADLVRAVKATGKKGSLTLKITLTPATKGENGTIETVTLEDEVSVKVPKSPRSASMFFVSDENTLERDNPRQPDLPFTVTQKPATAVAS